MVSSTAMMEVSMNGGKDCDISRNSMSTSVESFPTAESNATIARPTRAEKSSRNISSSGLPTNSENITF